MTARIQTFANDVRFADGMFASPPDTLWTRGKPIFSGKTKT